MEILKPDEIGRLSPPERLALIGQIWDSLEDEQLPLTALQQSELDHRLASLAEDRRDGIAWAALKAELEERGDAQYMCPVHRGQSAAERGDLSKLR